MACETVTENISPQKSAKQPHCGKKTKHLKNLTRDDVIPVNWLNSPGKVFENERVRPKAIDQYQVLREMGEDVGVSPSKSITERDGSLRVIEECSEEENDDLNASPKSSDQDDQKSKAAMIIEKVNEQNDFLQKDQQEIRKEMYSRLKHEFQEKISREFHQTARDLYKEYFGEEYHQAMSRSEELSALKAFSKQMDVLTKKWEVRTSEHSAKKTPNTSKTTSSCEDFCGASNSSQPQSYVKKSSAESLQNLIKSSRPSAIPRLKSLSNTHNVTTDPTATSKIPKPVHLTSQSDTSKSNLKGYYDVDKNLNESNQKFKEWTNIKSSRELLRRSSRIPKLKSRGQYCVNKLPDECKGDFQKGNLRITATRVEHIGDHNVKKLQEKPFSNVPTQTPPKYKRLSKTFSRENLYSDESARECSYQKKINSVVVEILHVNVIPSEESAMDSEFTRSLPKNKTPNKVNEPLKIKSVKSASSSVTSQNVNSKTLLFGKVKNKIPRIESCISSVNNSKPTSCFSSLFCSFFKLKRNKKATR